MAGIQQWQATGGSIAAPGSSVPAARRRPDRSVGTPGRRLLGLTWAHLLNDGAANYLPGVLPAVLVAVHEPVRMAGVLIAAMTVGQALQPVAGWFADRRGGRSLVVFGLLLSSTGGALLGLAPDTAVLIVTLLALGLGSAFFHPQALAGVRTLVQDRHGLRTSIFLVGGELGRGLWPTAASVVVSTLGLHWLWIVAVPGLVTAALLYRWVPDLPPRPGAGGAPIRWRHHGRPLALLTTYRSIRALTTYGVVTFIPILWHLRGGTLVAGASIITTMIVAGVVGNLWGGHLADRFGRRPVLVGSAIATAALIVPVFELRGPAVWVVAALLGMALFLTASTTVLLGQDIFPENRSMGSGIALGMANGIGAVLVLGVGFLVGVGAGGGAGGGTATGGVTVVFWVLAALSLAAVAPALAFSRSLMR